MSSAKHVLCSSCVLTLLVGSAHARVTDLDFSFQGTVSAVDLYNGTGDPFDSRNYTFVRNESFLVEGGPELLDFEASAMGGDFFPNGDLLIGSRSDVSISMIGSLASDGSLSLISTQDSEVAFNGAYPGDATAGTNVNFTFTLASAAEFTLIGSSGGGVDFGGASGTLVDVDGNSIAGFSSPFNANVNLSGTLEPGTYRFFSLTSTVASASFEFTVTPSPASLALLGASGVLMGRRRR